MSEVPKPIIGEKVYLNPEYGGGSNKVNWVYGIVTRIFPNEPAEAWITTIPDGHKIVEYLDYLIPTGIMYHFEK